LLRVAVIVALVLGAKEGALVLNWEPLSINPLFTGIVAANVFLMGFLLSGVLSDYYEASSGADVSLKPLEDTVTRLATIAAAAVPAAAPAPRKGR
jgi:hypothetical protein